ncbi:hypothetical protein PYW07_008402 [Mythimna separata]|uniref:Reverse transcriptase domain-containing protein n=1 Tax=Mythimna separata TaxID=271217 RepID=A0AAD7YCM8_MYTSE|nr:hypothetical protein PYW07_008402 [Mythimna separata]
MAMFDTDAEEIDCLIRGLRLNSAMGWDGIPATVIYSARNILIPVICHVFNLALASGVFPKVFKKAVVHPIHKSGDRDSVNNYRPISVLSILSKLLEKILNKRLLDYLCSLNILANNQYGFRSGKNTEDAILELLDSVAQNLNNKQKNIAVFLDLSKAFDTVSVPLLLDKLDTIGIRGLPLDMFRSYLSDRSQIVKIGNHISKEAFLTYGVPQGSVLGPTLFLVYINDLCTLDLTNSKVIAYADDTVILVHGSDWNEARLYAELALQTIMKWLTQNLLTLNLNKTTFITFSPRKASQPAPSFCLTAHSCHTVRGTFCGCTKIVRSDSIKYLGVWVDSALTWSDQINSLVSRVRKLIFVFKNLRTSANFSTLRTVYFALAHSILTYCISAWGGAGKCLMLRLERAQRAVLKVMAYKPFRFPTKELYRLWKLPTVRHSFVLSTVLRKHSSLTYDPDLSRRKRKTDRVCPTAVVKLEIVRRQFLFYSPVLYNRINKVLNIYPCASRECKRLLDDWLATLAYEELENFVKP